MRSLLEKAKLVEKELLSMCGFILLNNLSIGGQFNHFSDAVHDLTHRGPDDKQMLATQGKYAYYFYRLSIMDPSIKGRQPFKLNHKHLMCNGEIYNFKALRQFLRTQGYSFAGNSDCEVLIPLFEVVGIEVMVKMLDAEFAFVLVDEEQDKLFAARDPFGIRPMFYGYTYQTNQICFASEAKGLMKCCHSIKPFPPGHYYADGIFKQYHDVGEVSFMIEASLETITTQIRQKLETAVIKRLEADAPIGYLLSGGLDSSLVCAIAAHASDVPIQTFAIGMEHDPIDLKYAKDVSKALGTDHTEVLMSKADVLGALRDVIYHLETWDITTIRASIGMYLVAKYIHEHTDLKVLLTGEVSDELFGYKYTDFAPDAASFQKEAAKRVREIHMYDVLRADRTLAAHSLEARVPFADLDFASYVMSINPAHKRNTYGKGKYLLRKAFEKTDLLPTHILLREKAAFSDAVGHSMVDYLKEYAEETYSDEAFVEGIKKYPEQTPFTKESLLYREIFEEFYPGYSSWVKDFWMPNKAWIGDDINDPSARVLSNYGESGK